MTGLEHYDQELLDLDVRIRRLAIACGLDLGLHDTIADIIRGEFRACRQGSERLRRELRGLLMLKYHIEEHCLADLGHQQCLNIILDEERRLRERGFKA